MDHGFKLYTVATGLSQGTDGLQHYYCTEIDYCTLPRLEGSRFIIIAPYRILEGSGFIDSAHYRTWHDYCAGINYCTLPDIGG